MMTKIITISGIPIGPINMFVLLEVRLSQIGGLARGL
jgi:hypothetical protein